MSNLLRSGRVAAVRCFYYRCRIPMRAYNDSLVSSVSYLSVRRRWRFGDHTDMVGFSYQWLITGLTETIAHGGETRLCGLFAAKKHFHTEFLITRELLIVKWRITSAKEVFVLPIFVSVFVCVSTNFDEIVCMGGIYDDSNKRLNSDDDPDHDADPGILEEYLPQYKQSPLLVQITTSELFLTDSVITYFQFQFPPLLCFYCVTSDCRLETVVKE